VDVQAVNDRTTAWLRATLHARVDDRTVLVTDEMEDRIIGVYDGGDTVKLRPRMVPGLARPSGARFTPTGDPNSAQALTVDLLPAWTRRFWGSLRPLAGFRFITYLPDVARVRAYSRFGSGSGSWREREARLWRRAFWGASCEGREAMVAEATPRVRSQTRELSRRSSSTGAKTGRTAQAERDIAAVALGLRAPGMHLRGIDHLAPPRPPK
jgi:hypothetical protein